MSAKNRVSRGVSNLALCTGAGLSILTASIARAEEPAAVSEIIVTAERRDENLQEIPIAATVLTPDLIEAKGVDDVHVLQYVAPSLAISDGGGGIVVFNIRGLGRSDGFLDMQSGVAIYRDGIPTFASFFQLAPYYDLAGIEVLRGPQATFGGVSASAGAVFVRTADPQLGDWGGSLSAGVGSFQFIEGTAVLNAPIGENFAVRLAYNHLQRDHFYDSITSNALPGMPGITGTPGERDFRSYRLSAKWKPTDRFEALAKFEHDNLDFGGTPISTVGLDPLKPIVSGPFEGVDQSWRSILNLKYETPGGLTFSSLTGYQNVSGEQSSDANASRPQHYHVFRKDVDLHLWSQEFNVVSRDDQPLRWTAGVFLQRQLVKFNDVRFEGPASTPAALVYPTIATPILIYTDNWSMFGSVAYDVTSSVELKVGARYGQQEADQFTAFRRGNGAVAPTPFVDPAGGNWDNYSEDSLDGNIALNWLYNDDQFFYALISKGQTPGGTNQVPYFGDPNQHLRYRPMVVYNYELGWKASFFDDRVLSQFNVYHQTFEDYQVKITDPLVALGSGSFINAVGRGKLYGAEWSAQAKFDDLSVDLGVAIMDSEMAPMVVLNSFPPPATVNLAGNRSPYTPDFTGNVGVSYALRLTEALTVTPRVDVAHRTDFYVGPFNNPREIIEARTLVNAQVRADYGPWWAQLYATNLTDEHYVAGLTAVAPPSNATQDGQVYAGPPRQVGLRIGRKF